MDSQAVELVARQQAVKLDKQSGVKAVRRLVELLAKQGNQPVVKLLVARQRVAKQGP